MLMVAVVDTNLLCCFKMMMAKRKSDEDLWTFSSVLQVQLQARLHLLLQPAPVLWTHMDAGQHHRQVLHVWTR